MAELVIFDLDGTLMDTAVASIAAIRACAHEQGFSIPPEDTIRRAIGLANPAFYFHLYPDVPREAVLAFGNEVERREALLISETGTALAFPGVPDMLQSLRRSKKTLCIASTGNASHVNTALNTTGVAYNFEMICCGEADKTGMLRHILLSHSGKSAVMVGDTEIDAYAATANGIPSIGAAYGYCSHDRYGVFDEVASDTGSLLEMLVR